MHRLWSYPTQAGMTVESPQRVLELDALRGLAAIGVAKADLFPRVSLSGFLGFTAGRGSQIGSSAANAWALGPSITWAAFDLGSVRARLRGAALLWGLLLSPPVAAQPRS